MRPVATLLMLGLLAAPWARAEEAAVVAPGGPAVEAPAPAARPPVVRRRPAARPATRKPPPLDLSKHAALPPPPRTSSPLGSRAPVPNRDIERQPVLPDARTTLGPSLLYRNLPGRGLAEEGSPNLLEEKLYKPAPGARLRVPFAY